jgi:putative oxidoreductase
VLSLSFLHRFGPLSLLVARLLVGTVFVAHGVQKLVVGPVNIGSFFASAGIPAPTITAFLLTGLELVGGLLLIVGLGTRIVALLFILEMLGAIVFVHSGIGLITPSPSPAPGAEFPMALIAFLVVALCVGPGRLSVDGRLGGQVAVEDTRPAAART